MIHKKRKKNNILPEKKTYLNNLWTDICVTLSLYIGSGFNVVTVFDNKV